MFGSEKTKEIFNLKKQIVEMTDQIKQNQKDSESLNDLKTEIQKVSDRIGFVYSSLVRKIDEA